MECSFQTFDISSGDFLLEGKGMNATNIDRFDIVSRYAQLNANLYANTVNLMTGVNEFNYQTKSMFYFITKLSIYKP